MHDTGTGKVQEAECVKTATAPLPVALQRVDKASHHDGKKQEGPQFHTLGDSTGDNRHGRCHEDHLEKEVGETRVIGFTTAGNHIRSGIVFCSENTANTRPPCINCICGIHDAIAIEHVHNAGHGKQGDILG